jgi:putative ABC transport system ATP-binding protein
VVCNRSSAGDAACLTAAVLGGATVRVAGVGREEAPGDDPGPSRRPGVTFEIPHGQSVALMSRPPEVAVDLLDIVAGLRRPGWGSVLVDGVAVDRLTGAGLDRYRAGRGLLSARFPLLGSLSVTANVLAALPSSRLDAATRDRAAGLLELTGAAGLGGPARALSAEQQWRVLIARALLPSPRLVLAEDPGPAVGAGAATAVWDLLMDMHERFGFTLLVAASRPGAAVQCQRLITLTGWSVTSDELLSGDDQWTRGRIDRIGLATMRLATEYLGSRRGRLSIMAAICAVAIAFAVLSVGLTDPRGQSGTSIVLSALVMAAGELSFAVGAHGALRSHRAELTTLRALGWRASQVRSRLMLSFCTIGVVAGVPALAVSLTVTALLGGGRAQDWLALLSLPGTVAMVAAAAWWPVRRVTGERGGRGPLRMAHDLLRKPIRTAAGVLVIAAASAAVGVELTIDYGGPTWTGRAWLRRPATWQVSVIDVAAVVVVALLAAATVADLDWLAARERAVESSTLRALGWSALRMARLAAAEAMVLAAFAGVFDILGAIALARQMLAAGAARPGVVTWGILVALAAGAAGVTISLLAAGLAGLLGRDRR